MVLNGMHTNLFDQCFYAVDLQTSIPIFLLSLITSYLIEILTIPPTLIQL